MDPIELTDVEYRSISKFLLQRFREEALPAGHGAGCGVTGKTPRNWWVEHHDAESLKIPGFRDRQKNLAVAATRRMIHEKLLVNYHIDDDRTKPVNFQLRPLSTLEPEKTGGSGEEHASPQQSVTEVPLGEQSTISASAKDGQLMHLETNPVGERRGSMIITLRNVPSASRAKTMVRQDTEPQEEKERAGSTRPGIHPSVSETEAEEFLPKPQEEQGRTVVRFHDDEKENRPYPHQVAKITTREERTGVLEHLRYKRKLANELRAGIDDRAMVPKHKKRRYTELPDSIDGSDDDDSDSPLALRRAASRNASPARRSALAPLDGNHNHSAHLDESRRQSAASRLNVTTSGPVFKSSQPMESPRMNPKEEPVLTPPFALVQRLSTLRQTYPDASIDAVYDENRWYVRCDDCNRRYATQGNTFSTGSANTHLKSRAHELVLRERAAREHSAQTDNALETISPPSAPLVPAAAPQVLPTLFSESLGGMGLSAVYFGLGNFSRIQEDAVMTYQNLFKDMKNEMAASEAALSKTHQDALQEYEDLIECIDNSIAASEDAHRKKVDDMETRLAVSDRTRDEQFKQIQSWEERLRAVEQRCVDKVDAKVAEIGAFRASLESLETKNEILEKSAKMSHDRIVNQSERIKCLESEFRMAEEEQEKRENAYFKTIDKRLEHAMKKIEEKVTQLTVRLTSSEQTVVSLVQTNAAVDAKYASLLVNYNQAVADIGKLQQASAAFEVKSAGFKDMHNKLAHRAVQWADSTKTLHSSMKDLEQRYGENGGLRREEDGQLQVDALAQTQELAKNVKDVEQKMEIQRLKFITLDHTTAEWIDSGIKRCKRALDVVKMETAERINSFEKTHHERLEASDKKIMILTQIMEARQGQDTDEINSKIRNLESSWASCEDRFQVIASQTAELTASDASLIERIGKLDDRDTELAQDLHDQQEQINTNQIRWRDAIFDCINTALADKETLNKSIDDVTKNMAVLDTHTVEKIRSIEGTVADHARLTARSQSDHARSVDIKIHERFQAFEIVQGEFEDKTALRFSDLKNTCTDCYKILESSQAGQAIRLREQASELESIRKEWADRHKALENVLAEEYSRSQKHALSYASSEKERAEQLMALKKGHAEQAILLQQQISGLATVENDCAAQHEKIQRAHTEQIHAVREGIAKHNKSNRTSRDQIREVLEAALMEREHLLAKHEKAIQSVIQTCSNETAAAKRKQTKLIESHAEKIARVQQQMEDLEQAAQASDHLQSLVQNCKDQLAAAEGHLEKSLVAQNHKLESMQDRITEQDAVYKGYTARVGEAITSHAFARDLELQKRQEEIELLAQNQKHSIAVFHRDLEESLEQHHSQLRKTIKADVAERDQTLHQAHAEQVKALARRCKDEHAALDYKYEGQFNDLENNFKKDGAALNEENLLRVLALKAKLEQQGQRIDDLDSMSPELFKELGELRRFLRAVVMQSRAEKGPKARVRSRISTAACKV